MTWIRVDDHFADHPKAMALGKDRLAGLGLWHVAASYCARHLTDGFVPNDVVKAAGPARLVDRMVEVGLFDRVDGGYRLHDWLDYNPPRDKVLAERKAAKDRMDRRRSGEVPANNGRTNGEVREKFADPVPVPVPGVLSEVLSNGATDLDFIDPVAFFEELTKRRPSQKVRDWLEDLHARFSRTQLIAAMKTVPNPRETNWLRKVDEYLEHVA